MVAIKTQAASAFIKSPPKDLSTVLVFGSDPGLVSERSAALARTLAEREDPPGEVLRLDDASLEDDPGRISVELQTRPMFSGRRVLRATAGRRITAALLQPLLEAGPLDGLLIVEAGNLKPDEALRKLFETSRTSYAIACYPDSAADLESLVAEVLTASQHRIDPEARQLLLARLGADRALSRSELEKLTLYAAGRRDITADDVLAIVGDAADLAIEQITNAVARGDSGAAMSDYGRALASGENASAIISAVQRQFLRLHKARNDLDAGASLDDVLRAIRPPLHFKQRDSFAAALRTWTRPSLDQALKRIAEAAKTSRLSSRLEAIHGERLILALAAMSGSGRGASRSR